MSQQFNEDAPRDEAGEVRAEPTEEANEAAADGAASGAPDAEPDATEQQLVPVSEARKYRKRAQAAEKIAGDLQQAVEEKDAQLRAQQQALAELTHRQNIDELLQEAGAIDLESTRLLTEAVLAEMDEPDVEDAVANIVRRKPMLFHQPVRVGGVLSPRMAEAQPHEQIEDAAAKAYETGRRTDLLRYLRLRRRK